MRSQIFVRLHEKFAGRLGSLRTAPVKDFLCKMTENLQADSVQRRKPLFVRYSLNVVCVSYDGFDETEQTVFPDMITETEIIQQFYKKLPLGKH